MRLDSSVMMERPSSEPTLDSVEVRLSTLVFPRVACALACLSFSSLLTILAMSRFMMASSRPRLAPSFAATACLTVAMNTDVERVAVEPACCLASAAGMAGATLKATCRHREAPLPRRCNVLWRLRIGGVVAGRGDDVRASMDVLGGAAARCCCVPTRRRRRVEKASEGLTEKYSNCLCANIALEFYKAIARGMGRGNR